MKITLIHSHNRRENTYHVARIVAEKLDGDIQEFFLPQVCPSPCLGCFSCVYKGRESCPHFADINPVIDAMLKADVIIIASPTYCLEMAGQLKCFFDHLFTLWFPHRVEKAMFSKTAITISTAAGMGADKVAKSIAKQMFYLGIAKTYQLSVTVATTSWSEVKNKERINRKAQKIAVKINTKNGLSKPGLKTKLMFLIMRQMHKSNDWTPLDRQHWQNQGWLAKQRPY